MVAYRIPGAEFLSAAVIVVCFAIALILINLEVAGKIRTLGVLGVTLLFGCTILEAINGSLGSAYGTTTIVHQVGSIVVAVFAAAGMVLVVLAVGGARKARSVRGDHR